MYKYVLISEDDKEEEYIEQFPDMIKLVLFKDDNEHDELLCLIEFDDMDDFDYFQEQMLKRGNRIEIESNDTRDDNRAFWAASKGVPFMVIEDQHNIVDKTAWEELVGAYNGE